MGRNRPKVGTGTIESARYDIFGNVVEESSPDPIANTPTPVVPIQEVPPAQPPAPVKPIPTEVAPSDDRVKKAENALKKAQGELREYNRTMRRLRAEDEDLRQLLLLQQKSFNAPSASERQSASRKLRTELNKRGIAANDLRRLRDESYTRASDFEMTKEEIEKKINDAQYALVVVSSPIDFSKRPKASGRAQPQGPMQIDMKRMSPEEIVKRIESYAKGKTVGQFYQALFESLRHPSAAQQELFIQNGLNSSEIKALVNGMYGMFDKSKMKDKGVLTFRNGIRASSLMGGVAAALYNARAHTIELRERATPTILHEIAHALQHQFSGLNDVTDKWAEHRSSGERPVRRVTIGTRIISAPVGHMYRDHVDDPYTLHDNTLSSTRLRFPEVLSTSIQNMHKSSTLRDKQLFMTFIRAVQEVNGYY